MSAHNVNKTIPGTQAVARAIRVLKLFLGPEPSLTVAQVTERSGLNRTTAFRLIRVLETEGLLEQIESSGAYRIGPEVSALSRRAAGQRPSLQEVAQDQLDRLAEHCQETVSLETLKDGRARVAAEAMGGRVLGTMPCVGRSWALHATATGKVLLAGLPQQAREQLFSDTFERFTPSTKCTRSEVLAEVEAAARRGHAFNLEELELGYLAIAVPISDGAGGVLAAVGVGGPKGRVSRKHLRDWLAAIQDCASRIQRDWMQA